MKKITKITLKTLLMIKKNKQADFWQGDVVPTVKHILREQ